MADVNKEIRSGKWYININKLSLSHTASPNRFKIIYAENNNSLCFDAYSPPDYPIWYTVNITGKTINNTKWYYWHQIETTSLQCYSLESDIDDNNSEIICGPIFSNLVCDCCKCPGIYQEQQFQLYQKYVEVSRRGCIILSS